MLSHDDNKPYLSTSTYRVSEATSRFRRGFFKLCNRIHTNFYISEEEQKTSQIQNKTNGNRSISMNFAIFIYLRSKRTLFSFEICFSKKKEFGNRCICTQAFVAKRRKTAMVRNNSLRVREKSVFAFWKKIAKEFSHRSEKRIGGTQFEFY